jgi:hypothetical protein
MVALPAGSWPSWLQELEITLRRAAHGFPVTSMLNVIFTLDYEIHGNGEGDPEVLMVGPTDRMLGQFDRYGAKLTIMAEVAEILKFREHRDTTGRDQFHYQAIASQLCRAIRGGHDVQLHLHPSYCTAHYEHGHWVQELSEYNTAQLPPARLNEVILSGKNYLEDLLKPVNPAYECVAFRAGNWAVQPSHNLVRALLENGFRFDTSVFKYGRRTGCVHFDYSNAHSATSPWPVDERDICRRDAAGKLIEVPIYSESRWIGHFLTPARLYRAYLSRRHPFKVQADRARQINNNSGSEGGGISGAVRRALSRHAWKADFNQCSGKQLIRALERAEANHQGGAGTFVLIGHSKLFTKYNQQSIQPFLAFVADHPERFQFLGLSTVPVGGPEVGEVRHSRFQQCILSAELFCESCLPMQKTFKQATELMTGLMG